MLGPDHVPQVRDSRLGSETFVAGLPINDDLKGEAVGFEIRLRSLGGFSWGVETGRGVQEREGEKLMTNQ